MAFGFWVSMAFDGFCAFFAFSVYLFFVVVFSGVLLLVAFGFWWVLAFGSFRLLASFGLSMAFGFWRLLVPASCLAFGSFLKEYPWVGLGRHTPGNLGGGAGGRPRATRARPILDLGSSQG